MAEILALLVISFNSPGGRHFAGTVSIANQQSPKEAPVMAGVDVQRSATSSSFGALSKVAFNFVRDQTRTVGMLAWFVRNQMRSPKDRGKDHGWDHD